MYHGWTPRLKKVCTRCGGDNDNPLCDLCEKCHAFDNVIETQKVLNAWEKEWRDTYQSLREDRYPF